MVITLCSLQAGFGMTYFNSFTTFIFKLYKHNNVNVVDSRNLFNSIVTSMAPLGATIGAFTAGPLTLKGRRFTLILIDFVVIIGTILNIIMNFWTLNLGRLMIGWGAGAGSVV